MQGKIAATSKQFNDFQAITVTNNIGIDDSQSYNVLTLHRVNSESFYKFFISFSYVFVIKSTDEHEIVTVMCAKSCL